MSDPWLDRLPSREREKLRKRLRSPEEYERLREKVKGPEDLEREMEKNAEFAEVRLALESEPKAQERSKEAIRKFAAEQGIEKTVVSPDTHLQEAMKHGRFDVCVDHQSGEPALAIKIKDKTSVDAPSGKVSEVFPLSQALQQQILSSFRVSSKGD